MAPYSEDIAKQYDVLAKKHKLPFFEELGSVFEVEKIEEPGPYVLRAVRKVILEKYFATLSFFEMLLNPMNAPRMYLPFIKAMSVEEKKTIEQLYNDLGTVILKSLSLETQYNEKEEASMIADAWNVWQKQKPELRKLLERVAQPPTSNARKEKTYFG